MTQPPWLRAATARAASQAVPVPTAREETVPGRVALIDGDYLAYFASGGSDMRVDVSRRVAVERMQAVRELAGAQRVQMHLSARAGTKGERYLIATTQPYQGQRGGASRPQNWEAVREFLETADESLLRAHRVVWTDREADDGLAHAAATALDPVRGVVHHTADKDMRMLPGTHLAWANYARTEVPRGAYEVIGPHDGQVYGEKWFWMQMIQGDPADHIPGLVGLGPKRARTALAATTCSGEAYEVVAALYRSAKGPAWDDYFVEQAALLWLRHTAAPHDFMRVLPEAGQTALTAAVLRMTTHIKEQREALDRIAIETEATTDAGRTGRLVAADGPADHRPGARSLPSDGTPARRPEPLGERGPGAGRELGSPAGRRDGPDPVPARRGRLSGTARAASLGPAAPVVSHTGTGPVITQPARPCGTGITAAQESSCKGGIMTQQELALGAKHDAGQPRWSLLRFGLAAPLAGVVDVLTFGASKYADHSWRTVAHGWERYWSAMERHMNAIALAGPAARDAESGLLHVDHVTTNALFLAELARRGMAPPEAAR